MRSLLITQRSEIHLFRLQTLKMRTLPQIQILSPTHGLPQVRIHPVLLLPSQHSLVPQEQELEQELEEQEEQEEWEIPSAWTLLFSTK